jgi:hypothetical protein
MISEHYHTTNACKTDDAFTALMLTKRSKFFSSNFFGTLSIHISSIFLLLVIVGSLVDVIQEGG